MKRIFIAALGLLVFACAKKENYSIKGTAIGIPDGTEIYLQELGKNNKRNSLDTAKVMDESFVFTKPSAEGKGLLLLSTALDRQQLILVKDQAPLTVTLYKDSIPSSIVTGSAENELFNTYTKKSRQLNKKKAELRLALNKARQETDGIMVTEYSSQIQELDKQYINSKKEIIDGNSNSMVAIMALSDLINAKALKIEETENYYDGLASDIRKTTLGNSIKGYIAQSKSQRAASNLASVGNKAPAFSAQTPDGKELALSETLGKYTIVDFWASWCKPCRLENPNVVRVYNKYHDKGLNIISVSLDRPGHKERWIRAIEKDQMDWYHVSNLQHWQDPIPKSYGVRAIPATFLLDEEGTIIAKNLRGQALENKIAELLGDS
ncbi:thiol:disulfide interchange protein [Dokdonia pacifica]|uniref:Peroxiredoxin n=1 Tax=Dokdonia pacifica TaxID=1627892 RepID=A0A238YNU2_9FLAO|nr:TlpA disulfide reductase family protein [Dokdonia pacifica]GGG10977.1 thiol:disulfide interchange protein [Dokdonia pacifica]SNR72807.1 Peroxiredoxin [Dokdonia pacifica]